MSRSEHQFQFPASKISEAARAEAQYHEDRISYWDEEFENAKTRVIETAELEVKELPVTGGKRVDLSINYGDPAAYRRMQEAGQKIDRHREAAEKFRSDEKVYGSQDEERTYELSADDVHYFRLGGGRREE